MINNILKFLIVPLIFSFSFNSSAQFTGCPNVNAGNDTILDCVTACVDLVAQPFEVGETDSYTAEAIPHNPPIGYNQAGGTSVSVGTDDVYSSPINIPFDFCFYGQTYDQLQIGSNGAISLGAGAGANHPWEFSDQIPSTTLTSQGTDPGNIFGVYHDIDPSVSGGTIKYYILGSAPCRVFIVTYRNLTHFSFFSDDIKSTFMMVLYETTNAIDVYVEEKEINTDWNDGNALIGIQNQSGTQGIAAPGRNTGQWTVPAGSPEAYRFNPNGASVYTVEWLEAGNVIGTGNTINVCPSAPTTYTSRVTYEACSSNGDPIVVEDNVLVTPDPDSPQLSIVSVTPSSCNVNNGSFEVNASNGQAPYQYSIDNGVTFQSGGVFSNLATGSYNVIVTDDNSCAGGISVFVPEAKPQLNVSDSIVLCLGESWTPNATDADSYVWSGGVTNGVPVLGNLGTETFIVTGTSQNGCTATDSVVVTTFTSPSVSFIGQPTEGTPPLSVTFENTSSGANNYNWNYGDGFSEQDNNIFVNHLFQNGGVFTTTLTGTTVDGCSETASLTINVSFPDMVYEFPNVFTPNGDNTNDEFKINNLLNVESLEIEILNRWGSLVFESDDPNFRWNGKLFNSGSVLNDGTYFYKVILTDFYGKSKEEHGFIQLSNGN